MDRRGTNDQLIALRYTLDGPADARMAVVEDAAQYANFASPDAVNDILDDFLTRF